MKKICIIGAGFAGLSAVRKFSGSGHDIFLFDKKASSDFLPMLPDVIGRGIEPRTLAPEIAKIIISPKCRFVNEEVVSVDFSVRKINTTTGTFDYDYLLIAAGSESTYYGRQDLKVASWKLDSVADAVAIRKVLDERRFENYVVCGGGYTGIEVASNLRRLLNLKGEDGKVLIVERAPSILGPLPKWMKDYTVANLKRMKIDVATETSVDSVEGESVKLSSGTVLENSILIWSAGVKTPAFVDKISAEKNPQGRIKVDEFLRINESVFIAGDCACFSANGGCLRMGIQFSISQGRRAASNILNSICGRKLKSWKPFDPGYIIPMANNISCGNVLRVNMKGAFPTLLHYFMCLYRTVGVGNRTAIALKLLKGGMI